MQVFLPPEIRTHHSIKVSDAFFILFYSGLGRQVTNFAASVKGLSKLNETFSSNSNFKCGIKIIDFPSIVHDRTTYNGPTIIANETAWNIQAYLVQEDQAGNLIFSNRLPPTPTEYLGLFLRANRPDQKIGSYDIDASICLKRTSTAMMYERLSISTKITFDSTTNTATIGGKLKQIRVFFLFHYFLPFRYFIILSPLYLGTA